MPNNSFRSSDWFDTEEKSSSRTSRHEQTLDVDDQVLSKSMRLLARNCNPPVDPNAIVRKCFFRTAHFAASDNSQLIAPWCDFRIVLGIVDSCNGQCLPPVCKMTKEQEDRQPGLVPPKGEVQALEAKTFGCCCGLPC